MKTIEQLFLTPGSGNSFKPALVLHQTARRCPRRFVDVLAGEAKRDAFLKINPRGQVPYLLLTDGSGIAESNAIAWYLAEDTPLFPKTKESRAEAVQWMIFEQTAIEPHVGKSRLLLKYFPEQASQLKDEIAMSIDAAHKGLQHLDRHLNSQPFVTRCGYSVGDIAVFGYTHVAADCGIDLGIYPSIKKWVERIVNQPSYASMEQLLNPDGQSVAGPHGRH